ncbi:MAG: carboxypeptidase regulatory-like domain-containing protein [Planctomycetota bacterium]
MRVWAVFLALFVLAAVAWPVPEEPVRPRDLAVDATDPAPAATPVIPAPCSAAPRSRDPADPQPPPEPPPPPPTRIPTYPYGEILGCVEDEAGCAVASFSISSRSFGCHRRGWPAGEGTPGPGGTFRFRVRRLDFHLDPVPPGHEPSRWLFQVWADGFTVGTFHLGEEEEVDLRRGERVTGARIVLRRAVVVQGRVFGPDGHPCAGAWVSVTARDGERSTHVTQARTDGRGRFRFPHVKPRPELRIHATATRDKPKARTVSDRVPLGDDVAGGDLLRVDLSLGPWRPAK